MQKLIILDSETGICHIHNMDSEMYQDEENMEMYIGERFNIYNCQWMIALEVEDNTTTK